MSHRLRLAAFRAGVAFAATGLAGPSIRPLAAQATIIILARHGEKAVEPGANPALSAAGEARATALAQALASARLDAVFATEFTRTQRTAEPAAAAHHLRVRILPVHGDSLAHARAVAAAIRARPRGDAVLIVEHSNTIPAIIAALGGPELPELCSNEYATVFVLVRQPGREPRLIRSQFGAPDPADSECAAAAMSR
jgi:broad specificity phosphatase PhoE